MRLPYVLTSFALLLLVSTTTSFVGYRYLSLASEYRERNFLHLSDAHALLTLLDGAPTTLQHRHIDQARAHLEGTKAQAEWCLDVLNGFEEAVLRWMSAGRALDICEQDIRLNRGALDLLEAMEASFDRAGEGPTFAMGLRLQDFAAAILTDSRSFHPYVSLFEDKVALMVRSGTGATAVGLLILLLLLGTQLLRSQQASASQTREIVKLAKVAEQANDSIVVTDANQRITWVNPAFERLTGFCLVDVIGQRPGSFLQGSGTSEKARASIRTALAARKPIRTDILNYTREGAKYWANLSISPLIDESNTLTGYVAVSSDITRERENQRELEVAKDRINYQALHDPLTGLPNRRFIDDVIERHVTNTDEPRVLVRIDLDRFKSVNDTLGHAAGDFVLCRVADIMRSNVRSDDLCARVGGDEFVILLSEGTTDESALVLTERLRQEIQKDMRFEGHTCRIGASFGVSSAASGPIENEDLLKSADAALYLAKAKGRNTTYLYTPTIHRSVLERRRLSHELEQAIERHEFEAFFQPQFDAESEVLIGIEALVRWRHPVHGVLPPSAFLDVAEQLKLLPEIDRLVVNYSLDRAAELNAMRLFLPKLSFNVGMTQLLNPELSRILQSRNIGFTRISLEILESVFIEDENSNLLKRINELRSGEIGVEVDDFGSGHASVIALKSLSPDMMKIDRQLVAPIHEDRAARDLIACMIGMGKALNISVLAEGVETAIHAAILRDLGCDAFQGFYFAKPLPFDELVEFARNGFDEKTQRVTSLSVHRDGRL